LRVMECSSGFDAGRESAPDNCGEEPGYLIRLSLAVDTREGSRYIELSGQP
jgi:hypothetical protein